MDHGPVQRLIPAHAGNTWKARWPRRVRPAHPRACGEHRVPTSRRTGPGGSSPRMRGTLARVPDGDAERRLIPAHAGNTVVAAPEPGRPAAHPRACGEHICCCACPTWTGGSSPRMRGTPNENRRLTVTGRLIPAHAGNTVMRRCGMATTPAHPRACGEHRFQPLGIGAVAGSSPRMRGTRDPLQLHPDPARLIPAHAGNTNALARRLPASAAHPRACGEHSLTPPRRIFAPGSSPRMRGTPEPMHSSLASGRLIPAHAGNTRGRTAAAGRHAAHPRACGEHTIRPSTP